MQVCTSMAAPWNVMEQLEKWLRVLQVFFATSFFLNATIHINITLKIIIHINIILKIKSAPIGAREENLENYDYDRSTDRPTNQPTD